MSIRNIFIGSFPQNFIHKISFFADIDREMNFCRPMSGGNSKKAFWQ